jgi:hypothetical protein
MLISGSHPKARDKLKILRKDKKDLEFHLPSILEHFFGGQLIGMDRIYAKFIVVHLFLFRHQIFE